MAQENPKKNNRSEPHKIWDHVETGINALVVILMLATFVDACRKDMKKGDVDTLPDSDDVKNVIHKTQDALKTAQQQHLDLNNEEDRKAFNLIIKSSFGNSMSESQTALYANLVGMVMENTDPQPIINADSATVDSLIDQQLQRN